MSVTIYLLTLCLPLGTVILVFAIRYRTKVQEAKARLANDDAYRRIAETAAAAQSETATSLAAIRDTLYDVKTRLAAVEIILKAVG